MKSKRNLLFAQGNELFAQSILHFEQSSAIMHNIHNMIDVLKEALELFVMKYNPKARSGTGICVGNLSSSNPI